MICSRCHAKEATVIVSGSINGTTTTVHLCADCANSINEQLLKVFPGQAVDALLGLMGKAGPSPGSDPSGETDEDGGLCPECGCRFSGEGMPQLLGCPVCYTTFEDRLIPLFRQMHRGTRHVFSDEQAGADVDSSNVDRQVERQRLRARLQQAVADEQYEQAAEIRDALDRLTSLIEEAGKA